MEMNIIIEINHSPEEKRPNVTIFVSRMNITHNDFDISNYKLERICSSTQIFVSSKSKYIESSMIPISLKGYYKKYFFTLSIISKQINIRIIYNIQIFLIYRYTHLGNICKNRRKI